MTMSHDQLLKKIRGARERIWLDPPEELPAVATREAQGNQRLSIWLYAESDTRMFTEVMYVLRCCAMEESSDLETMKKCIGRLLEFIGSVLDRYYYQKEAAALSLETAQGLAAASDRASFLRLLEEYMLYFGKLNYWIDQQIPWGRLGALADKVFSGGN